ncbi:sulfotransferase family protein [Coraliomargarita sp. W4R72]
MTQPIFILSLPRSGSTLLQRLLLANEQFATLGEPSLLLRFLGDHQRIKRYTSYRDNNVEISMHDMRSKWPGFDQSYQKGVRNMMLEIYRNLAEGKRYFIDKTPRYTLIGEEILQTFPDAKFIVLWRHPLAIAASISSTFYKGLWHFDDFIIDLTTGLDRLHEFECAHADQICSVRYEDLVSHPAKTLSKVGDYLDVENLEALTDQALPASAGGTLGDPSGTKKYDALSADSRDRWISKYDNWYRRNWAIKYFQHSRAEWLRDLDYTLPDEIANAAKWTHFAAGTQEMYAVRKKMKSRDRRGLKAFKQHHISAFKLKLPPVTK